MFDSIKTKPIMVLLMFAIAAALSVGTAAAADPCASVVALNGACDIIVDVFNATIAVMSVITMTDNLTTVITFFIIVGLVTIIADLSRGSNSYIKRRFYK